MNQSGMLPRLSHPGIPFISLPCFALPCLAFPFLSFPFISFPFHFFLFFSFFFSFLLSFFLSCLILSFHFFFVFIFVLDCMEKHRGSSCACIPSAFHPTHPECGGYWAHSGVSELRPGLSLCKVQCELGSRCPPPPCRPPGSPFGGLEDFRGPVLDARSQSPVIFSTAQ